MNRGGRSPGSPWRWAVRIAAVAAVLFGGPAAARAQSLDQVLVQRRLVLRAARAEFEAARTAFNVVERQWSAALDDVARVRRSGNQEALARALAAAQDQSVPYGDRRRRYDDARVALTTRRQELISALDARLGQLVAQMDAAPSQRQRDQLDTIYRELNAELQGLESEAGDTVRLEPVVLPEVSFDPRDSPDDIRSKAEILERQAAVADTLIQTTDAQIASLNERLRQQRQRRDFLAGTDRFDDTRVPVVAGQPATERTPASDSTVTGQRPQTLEERVRILRVYRAQLEGYRNELLIRATQFRQRVRLMA